jgi:adenylyltransferase/sulfurtransferase
VSAADKRVLIVGAGGLGCAAAPILAEAGAMLTVIDDDVVTESNLHRQLLYETTDIGLKKGTVMLRSLAGSARWIDDRFTPDNARALVAEHDLVVEGADNFATKFLAADACALAHKPIVQAGAVRWTGFALASVRGRGACLRCVFEDLPREREETCAVAGVVGPVVGVLGALEAALALRLLAGDPSAAGELFAYDGLAGSLRRLRPAARLGCPACSGQIDDLDMGRYQAAQANA